MKYKIEMETTDSVTEDEAKGQWTDYDNAYEDGWYLAVPSKMESSANKLIDEFGIENCTVITWREDDETYYFSKFPD